MIPRHLLPLAGSIVILTYYLLTTQTMVFSLIEEYLNTRDLGNISFQRMIPPNPEVPQPPSYTSLHNYEKAAICSDSSICSNIGKDILQRDGSAVDGALATLLCNGLVAMQSMGLGGGVLMNIYSRQEQRAYSILSRERAPLSSRDKMFAGMRNSTQVLQSPLSMAVPGELMGYAVAHERFGKLPWAELVQPTIELCRRGYLLSKHQRDSLFSNKLKILSDKHLRKMFWDDYVENFYRVGTQIYPARELCDTYETLAEQGPRTFYTGMLSVKLLADLRDLDSSITKEDLMAYKTQIVESPILPLGSYLLHLTPPPGSGYIVGFVMNILNRFRRYFLRTKEIGAVEMHRIVEALKFGFVKRWELDANFDKRYLENISCPEYAAKLAYLINDSRTFDDPTYYGANENLMPNPDFGTAHISVMAPNGDAVSATSSINFYFGAGRTGERTGILFNNAMSDFAIDGVPNYFNLPNMKHRNRIKAGKSPMSSMAPLLVTNTDGSVRLVVGAAGGTKIISALTPLLVRVLWQDNSIKEAIDAARFHHQLVPNVLEYEYGIMQQVIDELEAQGHKTFRYRERGSAICGIERVGQRVFANMDYRKDGGVAGF